jgi:hypothetical protein
VRLRSSISCQAEVGLDLLPRDRGVPILHLRPSGCSGFEVGKVLGSRDEPLQVLGVDHRSDPLPASGQVDRRVLDASSVDDIGQSGSGVTDGHLAHATRVRRKR